MFLKIDNFLLDQIFNPISSFLHTWIGCSNFTLARIWYVVSMTANLYAIFVCRKPRTMLGSPVFLLLFTIACVFITYDIERRTKTSGDSACANPGRYGFFSFIFRSIFVISFLPLVMLLIVHSHQEDKIPFCRDIALLAYIFANYFEACSSKPKQRGRIWNFIPSFVGGRA